MHVLWVRHLVGHHRDESDIDVWKEVNVLCDFRVLVHCVSNQSVRIAYGYNQVPRSFDCSKRFAILESLAGRLHFLGVSPQTLQSRSVLVVIFSLVVLSNTTKDVLHTVKQKQCKDCTRTTFAECNLLQWLESHILVLVLWSISQCV